MTYSIRKDLVEEHRIRHKELSSHYLLESMCHNSTFTKEFHSKPGTHDMVIKVAGPRKLLSSMSVQTLAGLNRLVSKTWRHLQSGENIIAWCSADVQEHQTRLGLLILRCGWSAARTCRGIGPHCPLATGIKPWPLPSRETEAFYPTTHTHFKWRSRSGSAGTWCAPLPSSLVLRCSPTFLLIWDRDRHSSKNFGKHPHRCSQHSSCNNN